MASSSVVTRSFVNTRDGANLGETILTPDAVRKRGIKKLHTLTPSGGDARGCEAQPLVAPGADGRPLVVLCSMANVVEAFDLETGTRVWSRTLDRPIKGTQAIDGQGFENGRWVGINEFWGILSTPVIDLQHHKLYVCSWSSPAGTVEGARFALFEIGIADGHVLRTLELDGARYVPGHGLPIQMFNAAARKQRSALLLDRGIVYIAFGTIQETSSTAQGWIIAVAVDAMTIKSAWASTARGSGGGIWMAGQGPAAIGDGSIVFETGNGDFDGVTDFSQSVVRLGWEGEALAVLDWWSPFSDAGRKGDNPVDSDDAKATNVRPIAAMMNDNDYSDMDLGSAAPLPMLDRGLVMAAGKDGILYPVRLAHMGKTMPADFATPALNYAKLASRPIFSTFFAPDKDPAPDNVTALNFMYGGKTHHQHGAMVRLGDTLFTWGENGCLKAYFVEADGTVTWLADGAETASVESGAPPGGMPGGMISLSANGTSGAILWALIPYGNANAEITNGRFLAYDAQHFVNGRINVLWDSERWADVFTYNKFNIAVPVDGFILRPNYSGGVDVYGLTPVH